MDEEGAPPDGSALRFEPVTAAKVDFMLPAEPEAEADPAPRKTAICLRLSDADTATFTCPPIPSYPDRIKSARLVADVADQLFRVGGGGRVS